MPLSLDELSRIASLAKLSFGAEEQAALQENINAFFKLVDQMAAVDTRGVEPLFHPASILQDVQLRLQDDVAFEGDFRAANMQNAPAAEDGFFLVPKVIE